MGGAKARGGRERGRAEADVSWPCDSGGQGEVVIVIVLLVAVVAVVFVREGRRGVEGYLAPGCERRAWCHGGRG